MAYYDDYVSDHEFESFYGIESPKHPEWEDLEIQMQQIIESVENMSQSKTIDELEQCLQELCCYLDLEYLDQRCTREAI